MCGSIFEHISHRIVNILTHTSCVLLNLVVEALYADGMDARELAETATSTSCAEDLAAGFHSVTVEGRDQRRTFHTTKRLADGRVGHLLVPRNTCTLTES